MSLTVEDILVVEYDGPQGNVELVTCREASVDRSKSKTRVKTMNRARRPIAFQTGTKEVSVSLTIVPEKGKPEVDWIKAWEDEEEFTLVIEKGLGGRRELIEECQVESVNGSYNENGEASLEVSVMGLNNADQPE